MNILLTDKDFVSFFFSKFQKKADSALVFFFFYFLSSAEEVDANNERVLIKLASLPQATLSETCTVTDFSNVPYSVLMANGK